MGEAHRRAVSTMRREHRLTRRLQLPSDFPVRVFGAVHIEIHVAACESSDLLFRQNSRTLNRTLQWGDCDHLVRVSPLAGRAVEMGCLSLIAESPIGDCPGQLFACVIV